jgi:phosphatidylethanolamine/phosphatidyl-N-methylethanolamine N-methyltransferase
LTAERAPYTDYDRGGACHFFVTVMQFQTSLAEKKSQRFGGKRVLRLDRLDDEVTFIRSWLEKPLATGAVMPSGKALARAMASYVDPASTGPVVELGPGTGPVTEALVKRGVDPARLFLVEFNPSFCRLLRTRFPAATVVQGDAYSLKRLLETIMREPAAAVVSGLPLLTKPLRTRLRVINDALSVSQPDAPFIQFTYAMTTPLIPKGIARFEAEVSDRIWLNFPPARVWVYRKG